jgi:AcrR family transcriptional regulator
MSQSDSQPVPPAPRRTQVERRQDAERRLLDSAIDLIGRKGVQGLTLSDVGIEAGYSRGLVTHHYGTRDAFLRVVTEDLRRRFVDAEQLEPHAPGLEMVISLAELYLSGSGPNARAMNALMAEALVAGGSLQEDMQQFTAITRRFLAFHIRHGIEHGEIRADIDPRAHAIMILGMLRGVAAQALLHPDKVQLEAMGAEVIKGIRHMLVA